MVGVLRTYIRLWAGYWELEIVQFPGNPARFCSCVKNYSPLFVDEPTSAAARRVLVCGARTPRPFEGCIKKISLRCPDATSGRQRLGFERAAHQFRNLPRV